MCKSDYARIMRTGIEPHGPTDLALGRSIVLQSREEFLFVHLAKNEVFLVDAKPELLRPPTSPWTLLIEGIKQPMMVLLLSIAAISLAFGKLVEAIMMMFVVAAYISVEFINNRRSDRTMTRLRELT